MGVEGWKIQTTGCKTGSRMYYTNGEYSHYFAVTVN